MLRGKQRVLIAEDCFPSMHFLLTATDVKAWEAQHGEIGPGEWVVMRTDWDQRSNDEELFLNEDPDPREDGSYSPGPTTDCIDYLLS